MASIDHRLLLSDLSGGGQGFMKSLTAGRKFGQDVQKQQQSEQLTDIFSRNVIQDPQTGQAQLNKPQVLTDLFKVQPAAAVQLEKDWQAQDIQKQKALGGGNQKKFASDLFIGRDGNAYQLSNEPGQTELVPYTYQDGGQAKKYVAPLTPKEEAAIEYKSKKLGIEYAKLNQDEKKLLLKIDEGERKAKKFKKEDYAFWKKEAKADFTLEESLNSIDRLSTMTDELINNKDLDGVLGSIEGRRDTFLSQAANNILVDIEDFQSKTVLQGLEKLKTQSATGATGFGALNGPELDIIKQSIISLNRTQSPVKFRARLKKLGVDLRDMAKRMRAHNAKAVSKRPNNVAQPNQKNDPLGIR